MNSDPTLLDDFREFLRLLNAHRVDCLVVGGHAVSFHGYPRFTHGKTDLLANKQAVGRPEDLADIARLKMV